MHSNFCQLKKNQSKQTKLKLLMITLEFLPMRSSG